MPKISRDETRQRCTFALGLWRENPKLSVPEVNNSIRKKFGGQMNNQRLYKLRNALWAELGIDEKSIKERVKLSSSLGTGAVERALNNWEDHMRSKGKATTKKTTSRGKASKPLPQVTIGLTKTTGGMSAARKGGQMLPAEPLVLPVASPEQAEFLRDVFEKLNAGGYCTLEVEFTSKHALIHAPTA